MTRQVFRAGLCVLVVLSALLSSGAASGSPARAPDVRGGPAATAGEFVAVPVVKGSTRAEPPPFQCFFVWDVDAGGFYPRAWLEYGVTYECGEDFELGPDMVGVIQAGLHLGGGGLRIHTAPETPFVKCCPGEPPARSGAEYRPLTGPGTFFIRSSSVIDLMPEPAEGRVWIWITMPPGCTGLGTPRAVCEIDSDEFQV
ncbi:hypothetical protein [Plantactinospora sp. CA-290183]|uniref:hypothetical protein n=1 Tax=Plantactinospora sp. CA-290183 TaxID=3240006 RepID=UPI003D8A3B16